MDETNRDRGKREDMSKYVKMVTDVKRYLKSASERLTKLTLEREGLPVKNFAQEIVNFYKVLPKDLFMGKPSTYKGPDLESDYDSEVDQESPEIKKPKKTQRQQK